MEEVKDALRSCDDGGALLGLVAVLAVAVLAAGVDVAAV